MIFRLPPDGGNLDGGGGGVDPFNPPMVAPPASPVRFAGPIAGPISTQPVPRPITTGPASIDPVGTRVHLPLPITALPDPVSPTPVPAAPSPSTPTSCPDGQSILKSGYTRNFSDGSVIRNDTGKDMCAPTESTGNSAASTGVAPSPTTTVPATSGGSAAGGAADADLIKSLMGLVANQFAGAGVSGGGTGYDGVVSAPLAADATSGAAAASGPSRGILFLVLGIAVAVGLWYWHKHRNKK